MNKFIIMALLGLSACTDSSTTIDTLTKAEFEDIKITGWDALSCSEEDFYHTGFSA